MTDHLNPRESSEQLNLILDTLIDSIVVKDREHRIVYVNDVFMRNNGFIDRTEVLGKTMREVFPGRYSETLQNDEDEIFKSGKASLTEEEHLDGEDHLRVNLVKKSVIMDSQGNQLLLVQSRDLRDSRPLGHHAQHTQKMESLARLASKIAHDFNNFLNVINGYSEMVIEEIEENSPLLSDLKKIREAGQSAAALTAQLQRLSQKGSAVNRKDPLRLADVIVEIIPELEEIVGAGIQLEKNLYPAGAVEIDARDVRQILVSLVANARDAMPEGGTLTITTDNVTPERVRELRDDGNCNLSHTMLSVKDNGVGMDAATREHLFEPFFTTKGKGRGTGLSLSIVYGIVTRCGGFIEVISSPGNGADFRVFFPQLN